MVQHTRPPHEATHLHLHHQEEVRVVTMVVDHDHQVAALRVVVLQVVQAEAVVQEADRT